MSLFEAWRDGAIKSRTDYPACIPDAETLRSMAAGGYRFRLRGKPVSLKALLSGLPSLREEPTREISNPGGRRSR